MAIALKDILSLPVRLGDGIRYAFAGSLYTPKPRFVCFPVTFRCNSRCQMCHLWQTPGTTVDMDLKEIAAIFSNPLFNRVEEVVLHGGEPTLREDLKDIVGIILRACPRLKSLTLSTNGLDPDLVGRRLEEILAAAGSQAKKLTVTVSIDGLQGTHDRIRGVEGGFARSVKTVELLKRFRKEHPIDVKIITVIQPRNLPDMEAMLAFAEGLGLDIIFQPLMIDPFYLNSASDPRLQFTEEQKRRYRTFVETRLGRGLSPRSLYWRNFIKMMDGGRRTVPCAYDRYVLSLYPTGEVLPCSREQWITFGSVKDDDISRIWFSREAKAVRKKMKKEVCPTCSFYCGTEYALKKEFFTYLRFYLKKAFCPGLEKNRGNG
jgi:MoaA/NifB/PqqE/SkfB family radical SAM enzyme